jgi:hypothetical protein
MDSTTKVIVYGSLLTTLILAISTYYMIRNYNIPQIAVIENIITETLGTKATIGGLHLNPAQGTARISHLRVYNPGKGFSDGAALEIESIDITLAQSAQGVMRLSEVFASGIQSNLEVTASQNNLSAITNKMNNKKPVSDPGDTARIKIMIDNLSGADIRVRPRSLMIEGRDNPIVPLQDLVVPPVGINGQGVPAKTVIAQIWTQLSDHIQKGAQNAGYLRGSTISSAYDPGTQAEVDAEHEADPDAYRDQYKIPE